MKRSFPHFLLLLAAAIALLPAAGCAAPAAVSAIAPGERTSLPILMYHGVLKDPARAGDYIVPPDVLEADLRYLKEGGYTAVTVAELVAYVNGTGSLPERPVMLTFDDGYYNNLAYVQPLLEEYDMCAVLSVVGAFADRYTAAPDPNPSYACLSWPEILSLSEGGRFEIQCHSYDMHTLGARRGSGRRPGESETAYRHAFCRDTERFLARAAEYGLTPTAYAYPFGVIGADSGDWLRALGFSASLSCYERPNVLTVGDPDCLFCLGRYNRPAGLSTADYMKKALGDSFR